MKNVRKYIKSIFKEKEGKSVVERKYNPYIEDKILKEIKKDLNLKECIIVSINKKTFLKVFNKVRIETANKLIK